MLKYFLIRFKVLNADDKTQRFREIIILWILFLLPQADRTKLYFLPIIYFYTFHMSTFIDHYHSEAVGILIT